MSCKSNVPYNFGPASDLDNTLYGAARPGAKGQRCFNPDDKVKEEEVVEWANHMREAGVTRVIGLLTDSELQTYETPPTQVLTQHGFKAVNVNLEGTNPRDQMSVIESTLKEAEAAGEKVVVHCWGGGGRTGKVEAAWLVLRHGLTPEAAAETIEAAAKRLGTSRRADVAAVRELAGQQS